MSDLAERTISNVDSTIQEVEDYPPFSRGEKVSSHKPSMIPKTGKSLNQYRSYNRKHQVGVSEGGTKNLVQTKTVRKVEQYTTPTNVNVRIAEYTLQLLKEGYSESTIEGKTKLLKILVKRGANLFDPDSVKEVIAKQKNLVRRTKE